MGLLSHPLGNRKGVGRGAMVGDTIIDKVTVTCNANRAYLHTRQLANKCSLTERTVCVFKYTGQEL